MGAKPKGDTKVSFLLCNEYFSRTAMWEFQIAKIPENCAKIPTDTTTQPRGPKEIKEAEAAMVFDQRDLMRYGPIPDPTHFRFFKFDAMQSKAAWVGETLTNNQKLRSHGDLDAAQNLLDYYKFYTGTCTPTVDLAQQLSPSGMPTHKLVQTKKKSFPAPKALLEVEVRQSENECTKFKTGKWDCPSAAVLNKNVASLAHTSNIQDKESWFVTDKENKNEKPYTDIIGQTWRDAHLEARDGFQKKVTGVIEALDLAGDKNLQVFAYPNPKLGLGFLSSSKGKIANHGLKNCEHYTVEKFFAYSWTLCVVTSDAHKACTTYKLAYSAQQVNTKAIFCFVFITYIYVYIYIYIHVNKRQCDHL
jgi:hypothetical protein